jgi:hypothetical protein
VRLHGSLILKSNSPPNQLPVGIPTRTRERVAVDMAVDV